MVYERVKLGEVASIRGGKRLPAGKDFTTAETAHPYIRARDIGGGKVEIHDAVFLDQGTAQTLRRYTVNKGDVCLTIVGANVGEMGVVPPHLNGANLTENAVKIVTNGKADQAFLKYALLGDDAMGQMKVLAGGAAQPKLGIYKIETIEFPCPPLPVQRRIAGILSAYDELMENSQRRIRLLEAMARALYREWFVHFRFPGHEKHPRVASPLGDIPQGWEVCALGDFVQFKSGFAFKSGTFTADGEHRLVTIKNVQDGAFNPESDSRMSELPPNLPPYCVLKDGDILLSLTGNVGRVCLVYDGPFLLNQRVSKLAPVEAFDWAMTYCMFREPEMRVKLEQLSNGVAQQNLSPVLASKMDFSRPPGKLRRRFAELAEPMVRRIVQLYSTIQNLRQTRDLLLPRLLSGQVELKTEAA